MARILHFYILEIEKYYRLKKTNRDIEKLRKEVHYGTGKMGSVARD